MQLQQFGGPTDVLIRVAQQPGGEQAQQAALAQGAAGAWASEVDYRRVEVVGPRVSTELLAYEHDRARCSRSSRILVYLWFRFEWQFALGAMIANVHDLVLTIGFMSLTQIDFDLTSIAALLTILGYSLNDTVVIYDRIREMLRRYKRMPMPDLLNISVNSTLSRSIITHVTVTLALLALLLFGGHAIHSFTATMMFGVVLVGTYTSVFIAAPILIYLGVGTTRMEAEEPATEEADRIERGRRRSTANRISIVRTPCARIGIRSLRLSLAAPCRMHSPIARRWFARRTRTAFSPPCLLLPSIATRCLRSTPSTWKSRACARSFANPWRAKSGCNGGATCWAARAGARSRPIRWRRRCSRPWRATGCRRSGSRR